MGVVARAARQIQDSEVVTLMHTINSAAVQGCASRIQFFGINQAATLETVHVHKRFLLTLLARAYYSCFAIAIDHCIVVQSRCQSLFSVATVFFWSK
jgi:hypothetical protein